METNLNEYNKGSKILIDELLKGTYNLTEAQEQCSKLWNLIPSDIQLNPYRINTLMKERFGTDPNWNKYCKKFKIDGRSRFVNNEIMAESMRKIKKDLHN